MLLRDPTNIKTKDSTYSGVATNTSTNETLDIKFKSDFDPTSSDNLFTSFSTAIMAVYFWINGDFVQRDEFDFWVLMPFTKYVDCFYEVRIFFLVMYIQRQKLKVNRLY